MTELFENQPKTFEEALELVQGSPSLRKIKSYLDNSAFSADIKALLYDIAKITVKVGEAVVALGRHIFAVASALAAKFPNLVLGTLVALVVSTLIVSTLGSLPVIGGLAAILSKLIVLLGVTKGFLDDLRNNAAQSEMDRVSAQFSALNLGVVQK
ncbi:hypothetical protein ROG8370_02691 [Roseovarius gaetbuli]|uniref:Uncharacterized protein n=1 Tax=Roseovarius gaetbuli TaxID=1356575 RepID=A0A1X6ZQW0_9RHOB|nr:hypothetical protein [Roseovarius gaetbuli]SLN58859.1 hypothetical protein ROG8370_02691 [Roseovarius gaetbuli]